MIRRFGVVLIFVLAAAATVRGQESGPGVVQCSKCHAQPSFLEGRRAPTARDSTLFVTDSMLDRSVHAGLACADCHAGFDQGYPHEAKQVALPCQSCHASAGDAWGISIHAADAATGGAGATCVDCHGTHDVLNPEDRDAPTYALNVAGMCARCHEDPEIVGEYFDTPERAGARQAVQRYFQTVHGTAVTQAGLVVSATCNDCHRAHDILPPEDPRSSVNRSHIPETCGNCHVGILEVYEKSAHGQAFDTDEEKAPVCTSCHTSHEIVQADQPAWFLGVVEECGKCHEKLYDEYLQTYHGKVTRLGSGLAAQCSECHTAHRMLPASDPESTVNRDHLVETCGQCHAGANTNFVQYYAHGDHSDRHNFPKLYYPWLFMTTLLVGVLGFFGMHTILWLVRTAIDALRGGPKGDGP
jgi:nitrate/TMAO reductase-like tetraheme cytochrome c subunit